MILHVLNCTFFVLLCFCSESFAYAKDANKKNNCWVEAGERYNVDPWLLYAIGQQESGLNPLAINENNNKTYDIGLMQINSFWLPKLKEYGINAKDLYDPCTSINVGAWVLAQSIQVFGNNWQAVGAYNVGTKRNATKDRLRYEYAKSVYNRYNRNIERLRIN